MDAAPIPRFGALLWLMRASWGELLDTAEAIEEAGFESLWVSDHLLANTGDESDPVFESFTTLAGLASITRRPRLGTLVSAVSLRNPGLIAKAAVTIDHISGGRMTLGL